MEKMSLKKTLKALVVFSVALSTSGLFCLAANTATKAPIKIASAKRPIKIASANGVKGKSTKPAHKLKKKSKVSDVYGDAYYGKAGPIGVMAGPLPAVPVPPWKQRLVTGQQFAQNTPEFSSSARYDTLHAGVQDEEGPINILFLVDASRSMKEGLGGGVQKMEAAKQALQKAISQIPGSVNVGLRVFGQDYSGDTMIDCQQSQLLVRIGQDNRRSIIEQVRHLRPFGMTPLTWGLMHAARDLKECKGNKVIILISDGAETCGGEPCSYIQRLNEMGIKLKVDIVGLGLKKDHDAREQLNCIATASGGKYYDANTSSEFIDDISQSVSKAIEGKVLTKMSKPMINTITPPDTQTDESQPNK